MDRVIKQRKWTLRKIATYAGISALAVVLILMVVQASGGSKLKVKRDRLTISKVSSGAFQERIPINGTVMAKTTQFVTAIEGGQVESVVLKGGEIVKEGDMILKLSNSSLELQYMNLETNLLEQADQLRNTKIQMETSGLALKDQLALINSQLKDLGQQYKRSEKLYKDSVISEQDFMTLEANYQAAKQRRSIMLERIAKDSVLRVQQLIQVDQSLGLVARNLKAIQRSLSNLIIKAPINGQLSSVRVEIGENVTQGQQLGQVDKLDGFKVRAQIDEHYISRIDTGLTGVFTFGGSEYSLKIDRVYPEVTNGSFEVDMIFPTDSEPDGIKRGQNLQIRLALSDETQALLLAKGGFYQTTGGNWVYVVDESTGTAFKRNIRIGRQSDRYYEVLEGLSENELIIVSSYDSYNDIDQLILQDG